MWAEYRLSAVSRYLPSSSSYGHGHRHEECLVDGAYRVIYGLKSALMRFVDSPELVRQPLQDSIQPLDPVLSVGRPGVGVLRFRREMLSAGMRQRGARRGPLAD